MTPTPNHLTIIFQKISEEFPRNHIFPSRSMIPTVRACFLLSVSYTFLLIFPMLFYNSLRFPWGFPKNEPSINQTPSQFVWPKKSFSFQVISSFWTTRILKPSPMIKRRVRTDWRFFLWNGEMVMAFFWVAFFRKNEKVGTTFFSGMSIFANNVTPFGKRNPYKLPILFPYL